MTNKNTAAILAFFGGLIGLHKFYLKEPGAGIFYILLTFLTARFFLPVSIILGVLDAIRLFSMSQEQFDAKYNKGRRRNSQPRQRQNQGYNQRQRSRTAMQEEIRMERDRNNHHNKIAKKQRNNPFRKSADKKFEEYDLDGALEDYQKATEITPADSLMHFNLACIYSLKENTDKSLHHLEKAISMGFKNVEKINTKDELAYLRIQPEFEKFVADGYSRKNRPTEMTPPKGDLLQNDALLAQLNKLKEMRERGLLSDKEFAYEKERLTRK